MSDYNESNRCLQRLVKRLVFIDDDQDNRRQWLEWSERNGYTAKAFATAFEANEHAADCYIFDVSAVSPMMIGHHAYAPIARLMQDHPGSEIIIGSCMSRNAVEAVLDDVEHMTGRRPRFFDASSGFAGLEAVMKKINDRAQQTLELQPGRDSRVPCSAWLGRVATN